MRTEFRHIGRAQIVLVGFSKTLLAPLADVLPPGSVLVVEEPDVADRRDVATLAADQPAVDRVIRWEYHRPGAMEALLRAEPSVKAALAVLPGIEYAVTPAAVLADLLGLPGAGVRAGQVFRDKAAQRAMAAASGLRNPAHAVVTDLAQAEAFLASVGGPCVVKPTTRQAGLGVRFVSDPVDLPAAFAAAAAAADTALLPDRGIPSAVLVEQAVTGAEYSVELLVAGGQLCFANVTAKQVAPGLYPVELGHVVPGEPTPELASELVEGTVRLAAQCGFGAGALHCEWIVTAAGPVLVECAARMPGDEIGTLVSLAYDFPMTTAYLEVLLGGRPTLPRRPSRGAAIRFLTAPPGVVEAVTGVAEAERAAGVRTVRVTASEGQVLAPVTSSWDRVGYVLATGPDAATAQARAAEAAELVAVRTRTP